MVFTTGQLVSILGCSQALESKYLDPINAACAKFNITTKLQLAAFIAQVGHESGRLATTVENLNYSADGLAKTWPSRFTIATAPSYARNQEKIANKVYADRMGNGSESSGDGWKYRGRGLIQVTGKSNYDAYSQASGFNAIGSPDSLAEATHAAMSAGWFWNSKGLNSYADRSDFTSITKRINGGTNGQADRELLYKKALIVLSGGVPPKDDVVDKAPMPAPADGAPTSQVSDQKTPGAQNSSIVEPRAALNGESKSKYPWNFVNASRSGHINEVDDTPGFERLNMTHRTGSYWEMDNTGTFTQKSILDFYQIAKYDMYSYTGGNYTQQVKGQSYVQVGGDSVTKVAGTLYANAGKVQFNTGMVSASGEINAPNINSTIFGPMGGMAFGDLLAKEAMVAYDIKKGKAPMLGQSLGFKSAPGATEAGSADGLMPNKLDKQSPAGTPWITNGISTAVGVVTVAAMAAGVLDMFKKDTPSKELENAMKSAAGDIDKASTAASKETPVFVKHVSFAKPTLISQSTTLDKPDPSLYVNNIHTIVSSTGNGKLYMSNGVDWIPVGDAAASDHDYTDEQIAHVIDQISQSELRSTNQLLAEAQARAAAILNEAAQRQQDLEDEARARQLEIVNGILAEAVARGADIRAEAIIRQTDDESLSNRILELTASSSAEIAAAIFEERQARTTAIEAEAFLRLTLAAKVDQNVASITEETITRSTETSALSTRITNYIASNDSDIASFKTEITVKVDDQGNALATRIDEQQAANENNAAMITSESTSRVTADSALSTRIDTVFASTNSNAVAVQSETTARTTADTALGQRIDTLTATVTGGLTVGVNVLTNAGFTESITSANLPDTWAVTTANGTTTSTMQANGPDGYKFVRIAFSAASVSTTLRNGLKSANYSSTTIRKDTDYIFAARVKANSANMVGRKVTLVNTDNAFTATVISQPNLTLDWQWMIIKCRWTTTSNRNFYINTVLGDSNAVGSYTFDIATPIVHEGSIFLGFNLGTDQRILTNTTLISSESTVRADADSALSTRVDVVSSSTTTAQNTANAANTAAGTAQTAANNAQTAANAANSEIADISSDNILSKSEKSAIILEWNVIINERPGIINQADALSVPRVSYFNAVDALLTYLQSIPPNSTSWGDINVNSVIVGVTFRSKFALVYTERQNLLNAIVDKTKALADIGIAKNTADIITEKTARTDADSALATSITTVQTSSTNAMNTATAAGTAANNAQNTANTANTAANAAQASANAAQTAADAANTQITNISSDNILSKSEKSDVILNKNIIDSEISDIRAKADLFAISRVAYDAAYSALGTYLTGLGASNAWSDTTKDTVIVGTTFRTKFSDYYNARQLLLNDISAKAKTLADAAQTTANTANTAANNAQTTANAANTAASAAQTAANNAQNTANTANTAASSAQTSANAAQTAADAANTQITNIASDNILSKSEKSQVILDKNSIDGELVDIRAKADLFAISRVAYDASYTSLITYLTGLGASNEWSDVTKDTVIVGTTFRTKFTDYYTARQSLLNSISAKAKTLADTAQTAANTAQTAANTAQTTANTANAAASAAQTAANTAQTAANNAQTAADTANSAIASISSDNILSKGEKPDIILKKNSIDGELVSIRTSADLFASSRVSYDAAYSALGTYLSGLGASNEWSDVTKDTVIVGSVFRTKFTDYYNARQLLLNDIAAKTKVLADNAQTAANTAQTTANTANAAASAAQNAANNANNAIASISDDNTLSAGEKSLIRKEWDIAVGEQANINTTSSSFPSTSDELLVYNNAVQELGIYLNAGIAYTISLTIPPSWIADANLNINTAIVGSVFRSMWNDLYSARQILLNKISIEASKVALWANISGQVNAPANNATVGAPSGTPVGNTTADLVSTVANNFNTRNDRLDSPIQSVIFTKDVDIDHTINTDGSCTLSVEWEWDGKESDIDGFIVTIKQGSAPTLSNLL